MVAKIKEQGLIKMSNFKISNASYHDIRYVDRGIDRNLINEAGTCQFIDTNSSRIVHNAIWIYTGNLNMREYYSKQKEK